MIKDIIEKKKTFNPSDVFGLKIYIITDKDHKEMFDLESGEVKPFEGKNIYYSWKKNKNFIIGTKEKALKIIKDSGEDPKDFDIVELQVPSEKELKKLKEGKEMSVLKDIMDALQESKEQNEAELSELQKAYRSYFECWMKKYDITSPAELDEAKMKQFFNDVADNWNNGKGPKSDSPCK